MMAVVMSGHDNSFLLQWTTAILPCHLSRILLNNQPLGVCELMQDEIVVLELDKIFALMLDKIFVLVLNKIFALVLDEIFFFREIALGGYMSCSGLLIGQCL